MKVSKKILAIALSVLLILSVMPFAVFAGNVADVADQTSLQAAIDNANDGDTIRFVADTDYSTARIYVIDGKNITFDLFGHTQKYIISGETAITYITDLFVLENGASLEVKDSIGGGAIYGRYNANSGSYMFDILDTSSMTLTSGALILDQTNRSGAVVYAKGTSTFTMNGGEVSTVNKATGTNYKDCGLNIADTAKAVINDGTITAEDNSLGKSETEINGGTFIGPISATAGKIEINGGTFLQADGETANTAVVAYLADDEVIDANGQIATVAATTVAKVGNEQFSSIDDAFAYIAAYSGTTLNVLLLDDVAATTRLTVNGGKTVNIDLNGFDMDFTSAPDFAIQISDTDGTKGVLEFKGTGTVSRANAGNTLIGIYGKDGKSSSNAKLQIGSGVTVSSNEYTILVRNNAGSADGVMINVNGKVIGNYAGIYANGNINDTTGNVCTVNVNSTGEVTGTEAGIYAAGYAKYNVNGKVTGGTGIYMAQGILTVNNDNAVITGNGAAAAYEYNGNGFEPTGDGIVIDNKYANEPQVSIKKGSVVSTQAGTVAISSHYSGEDGGDVMAPISTSVIPATSTAVFSSDVSALAEDGYKTTYDATAGGYVVIEADAVAEVNGVRYASFEEALAAISTVSTAKHSKAVDPNYDYKTYVANGTIKLLADTTSNGIIIGSGSNLVVDFNGHTLDINAKPVGSNGTESIALQLLKNSDITFKNGTLTSSYTYSKTDTEYIQRLIQNYSNLTLDNMNVTMTGNFMKAITISTCNGDFVVKDSTVSAPDFSAYGYTTAMAAEQLGAEAFAFGTFSGYTAATATVQGNSTINGNVSVGVTNPDVSTNTLTLTGGTLNGDIVMKDNANSEGVEITKANTFTQEAPEGYKWVDNGDGTSTIAVVDASNGSSLTLTDGVKFNAYIDADAYGVDANEAVVKLTYNHNADVSKTKAFSTDTIALTDATKYVKAGDPYDGTYKFAFAVAPAQYAENITIELYATADAETPLFTTTTSVKSMGEKVIALAETDSAYTAYANLCKALADYCQAAQVFFSYDAPAAPAYYNEAVTTLAAADMEVPSAFVGIEGAGFSFTIVSALEVNVFYNGDLEIQNVSIDSTKGADAVKAETTTKSGRNCINITGIASGNLDNVITVNTSAGVVELSATNIAKAIAGSTNTNYANLARALYLYSVQASAFFGA